MVTGRTTRKKRKRKLKIGGELSFDSALYADIAALVLANIRGVKPAGGDLIGGFFGRLFALGASHPGINVEERDGALEFHIDIVALHGANLYDLSLEVQRRIAERVKQMTSRICVVNINIRDVSL